MTESPSHRRAKAKAAGPGGQTEKPLGGGKRLDAVTRDGARATEVERSGSTEGLRKAVSRLRQSKARQKILQVPHKDIPAAAKAMRKAGVGRTVKNMSGTKSHSVRKPK